MTVGPGEEGRGLDVADATDEGHVEEEVGGEASPPFGKGRGLSASRSRSVSDGISGPPLVADGTGHSDLTEGP
jgi:hypothetical protein